MKQLDEGLGLLLTIVAFALALLFLNYGDRIANRLLGGC